MQRIFTCSSLEISQETQRPPVGLRVLICLECPLPPNTQFLHSIYPNGTQVAFVPTPGGGFDAILSVGNDANFASLTGSLTVSVNNGFTFDVNSFDTLRNPQTLLSSSFSFGPNQAFTGITAHLTSADQYILITGVANGDNSGSFPFSLALSPTTIPEPSSLLLFASGLGVFKILAKGRKMNDSSLKEHTLEAVIKPSLA